MELSSKSVRDSDADVSPAHAFHLSLRLKRRDLIALYMRAFADDRRRKMRELLVVTVLLALVALCGFIFWYATGRAMFLMALSAIAAACFVGYTLFWNSRWPRAVAAYADAAIAESPSFALPTEVRISSEGIYAQDALSEGRVRWPVIHRIESTREHVFFYLSRYSGYIVPKRAFDSDESFDRFERTVRRWRAAHPPSSGICPQCGYSLAQLDRDGCPECGWNRE